MAHSIYIYMELVPRRAGRDVYIAMSLCMRVQHCYVSSRNGIGLLLSGWLLRVALHARLHAIRVYAFQSKSCPLLLSFPWGAMRPQPTGDTTNFVHTHTSDVSV